jgi:hypothetical protein
MDTLRYLAVWIFFKGRANTTRMSFHAGIAQAIAGIMTLSGFFLKGAEKCDMSHFCGATFV